MGRTWSRRGQPWRKSTPTSRQREAIRSSMACCRRIMQNTKHSRSRRESMNGQNSASTSFPVFGRIAGGSGLEITSGRVVRVPEKWHWPVGISVSNEIGYQRAAFSPDTWTWEIRPIVDRKIGRWYLDFNPTLDRSFHGPSVNKSVEFSPNVRFSYDLTKMIAGRARVLWFLWIAKRFRCAARSGATVFSHHRRRFRAGMGVQFRSRHRRNALHRPPYSPNSPMHRGRRFSWPQGKSAKRKTTTP